PHTRLASLYSRPERARSAGCAPFIGRTGARRAASSHLPILHHYFLTEPVLRCHPERARGTRASEGSFAPAALRMMGACARPPPHEASSCDPPAQAPAGLLPDGPPHLARGDPGDSDQRAGAGDAGDAAAAPGARTPKWKTPCSTRRKSSGAT